MFRPWTKDGLPAGPDTGGTDTRLAWGAFVVALTLTATVWVLSVVNADEAARQRFSLRVEVIKDQIDTRIVTYGQAVRSAASLFHAFPQVGRDHWNQFVEQLGVDRRYPGIQALAFARAVASADVPDLEAALRAEGIGGFRVWPAAGQGPRVVNLYSAPVNTMNLKALGFDLMSDPLRRTAVETARDTGRMAATPAVTLKIDGDGPASPSIILFEPVYRFGSIRNSPEERRDAFAGVVLSPIRIAAMLDGVLDAEARSVAVSVYDGWSDSGTPIYRSGESLSAHPRLSEVRTIGIGNRVWTIRFESLPAFEAAQDTVRPSVVLSVGLLISALLFAVVWALAATRSRAVRLAAEMTGSLRRREAELNQLFSQAPLGIALVGLDGRVMDCNEAFARALRLDRDAVVGVDLRSGVENDAVVEALDAAMQGERRSLETDGLIVRGARCGPLSLHVQPVYEMDGMLFVLLFAEDIGERRQAERRIQHLAHYDPLTGLPNRILLFDRLDQALRQSREDGSRIAVLFIDLDRFKVINDSLGHSFGDEILRGVAKRLRMTVRASDTVARLGGDEFLILAPRVADADDIAALAETVRERLGRPFLVNGHRHVLTPSIGIALAPDDATDVEGLIRCADIAMYGAKDAGRNAVRFVTPEMGQRSRDRLELEAALRHALEADELFVVYQPQVRIDDGSVVGLEALLRWRRPGVGTVLPGLFLPVAEETGLIVPMGDWVLDHVCQQIRVWKDRLGICVPVAVNLSGVQFRDAGLPERIGAALDASGLVGPELEVEVTESVLIGDLSAAASTLMAVKARGVRIALDDFGTGYSSLGYLHRFPIDKLKIDRSFIRGLEDDAAANSIPRAIVGLGRSLGLTVVAEGVETEAQLHLLRDLRCDAAQGYLFSRPVEADQLTPILVRNVPPAARLDAASGAVPA